MKKLVFAVMAIMCVLLMGCSKSGGSNASASSKVDSSAPKDDRLTIRLVTDATGIDDKSFNAAAWRGVLAYYGDTWENQKGRGTLYDNITCQTQDMYIPTLRQVSDEAPDLIITTGFTFADALAEVAEQYPDQKYMIVDVDWVNLPNVMNFVFREEQGSFLVGMAAALQAQEEGVSNPRFGFIGGVPGATITKFEMGYIQGVHSVIPNAPIVDYYANNWGAPQLAKTQAKNWYDSGVYAIFSAAGGTGGGTIAQAKEYREQGKNVWAIGVDSDQYEEGIYSGTKSAVLTSMLKRVETASLYAINAIEKGSFKGEVINLNMAQDGVGFATTNPELSANVVAKVNAAQDDINSGKINIYGTYKDALAAGAAPAGLGAIDD